MIPLLDLRTPIVPGIGLGGFEVSRSLSEYQELLRADNAVEPRVHGLWQVVYRFGQIYEATNEELEAHFDAWDEFRRKKAGGLEADLEDVLQPIKPPDSEPAIDLWVDVRDGIVDAVAALPGYEGRLGALRAGMTYGEARAAEARMTDVSFLDETTIEGIEGVTLWFDPPDPDPGSRDRARLEAIVVFDASRTDNGIKPL